MILTGDLLRQNLVPPAPEFAPIGNWDDESPEPSQEEQDDSQASVPDGDE